MKKVKKYNYLDAVVSTGRYEFLKREKQLKITNSRLKELLKDTVANNPFFRELYKDVNIEDISLETLSLLPATNKTMLSEHFNEWTNNEDLTKEKIEEFLSDETNFTKKYLNKYTVYQTSGTTGEPVTVINDKAGLKITMVIGLLRSFESLMDFVVMARHGLRTACILPVKTPCISTFLAKTAGDLFFNRGKIKIIDIEQDVSDVVTQLNEFQPVTVGGYCTFVEMLLDEAEKGNLKISPKYVTTVGEKLTKQVKEKISNTFGCKTLTNYACTECAEIAYMCKEGNYHINEDWTIVEPVDNDNNKVEDGQLSDKILVTNLWNYTQPFIRYEMNDRCIMHSEPCKCGCKTKWLEVEGRSFKVLEFANKEGTTTKISPITVEIMIHNDDEGIKRYQFILNKDVIEIRLDVLDGYDKQEVFGRMKENIEKFLAENEIKALDIVLSDKKPSVDKSGKFKQVYQVK